MLKVEWKDITVPTVLEKAGIESIPINIRTREMDSATILSLINLDKAARGHYITAWLMILHGIRCHPRKCDDDRITTKFNNLKCRIGSAHSKLRADEVLVKKLLDEYTDCDFLLVGERTDSSRWGQPTGIAYWDEEWCSFKRAPSEMDEKIKHFYMPLSIDIYVLAMHFFEKHDSYSDWLYASHSLLDNPKTPLVPVGTTLLMGEDKTPCTISEYVYEKFRPYNVCYNGAKCVMSFTEDEIIRNGTIIDPVKQLGIYSPGTKVYHMHGEPYIIDELIGEYYHITSDPDNPQLTLPIEFVEKTFTFTKALYKLKDTIRTTKGRKAIRQIKAVSGIPYYQITTSGKFFSEEDILLLEKQYNETTIPAIVNEPTTPITKQKETIMSTLKTTANKVLDTNKSAMYLTARLGIGQAANATLSRLVKKKLPMMVRGYAEEPIGKLVIANLVNFAVQQYAADNERAVAVSEAMVQASMVDILSELDVDTLIGELLESVPKGKLNKFMSLKSDVIDHEE